MKIVDIIPRIYTGLGEIDQQELPMSIVLDALDSVLNLNLKKLNISDLNWFMTSFIISVFPEMDDYEDFPGDWGREIRAQWTPDRVRWGPLDLVNVDYLDEIGYGQRPSAGIYGTPPHLKIRNAPVGTIAVRIWYEPDVAAPVNWTANLNQSVKAGFEPGIIAQVKFMCSPHVRSGVSPALMAVIEYENQQWNAVLDENRYRPRLTGRVPKRGFLVGGSRRWR